MDLDEVKHLLLEVRNRLKEVQVSEEVISAAVVAMTPNAETDTVR